MDISCYLRGKWSKIRRVRSKENLLRLFVTLANHFRDYNYVEQWPNRLMALLFRPRTADPMTLPQVTELMIFFVGNDFNVICAAKWVMMRIVLRSAPNKDALFRQQIMWIKRIQKTQENDKIPVRYFDLLQYKMVSLKR